MCDFREQVTREDPDGLEPEELRELLEGVQGNILKHHGRAYSAHLMIRFLEDGIEEALEWISAFDASSAWQERCERPKIFKMLALTRAGYEALGILPKDQPRDQVFGAGPGGRRPRYMSPAGVVENPFAEIHAMVIVATDDEKICQEKDWGEREAGAVRGKKVKLDFCKIETVPGRMIWADGKEGYEIGKRPTNREAYPIEHFGYHDGISNPLFLKPKDSEAASTGSSLPEASSGYGTWNTFAPLNLVLSEEPPRSRYLVNSYGSYLAVQKLEQDVPGFLRSVRRLALQFAVDDTAEKLATDLSNSENAAVVIRAETWDPEFDRFIEAFEAYLRSPLSPERRSAAYTYAESLKGDPKFQGAVLRTEPPTEREIERAGAMVVGRYRNGIPAFVPLKEIDDPVAATPGWRSNDFDYATADPDGMACPFHAHTRCMNSRGELFKDDRRRSARDPRAHAPEAERSYRIARRGVPYGPVDKASLAKRSQYQDGDLYTDRAAAAQSGEPRGLMFMSFQADLESFEMLEDSANDRNFRSSAVALRNGSDPVIGRMSSEYGQFRWQQDWPRPPKGDGTTKYSFYNYVKSRGEAYLFAPSLEFLRNIKEISVHTRTDWGLGRKSE